jgi:transcriptional regulator with XRE-family HTH domain
MWRASDRSLDSGIDTGYHPGIDTEEVGMLDNEIAALGEARDVFEAVSSETLSVRRGLSELGSNVESAQNNIFTADHEWQMANERFDSPSFHGDEAGGASADADTQRRQHERELELEREYDAAEVLRKDFEAAHEPEIRAFESARRELWRQRVAVKDTAVDLANRAVRDQDLAALLTVDWGSVLMSWRKAERLTTRDVADVLGVGQATVSRYATGQRVPGVETVLAQAQRLMAENPDPDSWKSQPPRPKLLGGPEPTSTPESMAQLVKQHDRAIAVLLTACDDLEVADIVALSQLARNPETLRLLSNPGPDPLRRALKGALAVTEGSP